MADQAFTATGRVDQIRDGIAYVTIVEPGDKVSYGEIEVDKLASCGISDQDHFSIETKNGDLVFTKLPRVVLTDAELAEIKRKIDEAFPPDEVEEL